MNDTTPESIEAEQAAWVALQARMHAPVTYDDPSWNDAPSWDTSGLSTSDADLLAAYDAELEAYAEANELVTQTPDETLATYRRERDLYGINVAAQVVYALDGIDGLKLIVATMRDGEFYSIQDPAREAWDLDKATQVAADRIRVQNAAQAIVRSEKAAAIVMPDAFTGLSFMELDTPDEKYLIDELWPTGGNVLFAAQRKAGKSTVVHNLIRSLLDGDPFMDTFTVGEPKRVALLDFELGTPTLQEWLGAQQIENMGNLTVIPMRGRAGSFDILDDKTRARWANTLQGFDVLILDPLRPILHALGLNEWNETGPLLGAIDALKVEAGISEAMVVQHHGHHAERAAGDSNLLGWSDANWDLTRENADDPRSFRFFGAYGRDVDVDLGLVSIYDGKRLAFARDARNAKADAVGDRVVEYVNANPGCTSADLLNVKGVNAGNRKTIVSRLNEAERIRVESKGTANYHHPAAL